MGQLCPHGHKAKGILTWIRKCGQLDQSSDCPLNLAMVRLHRKPGIQFWAPQDKKDLEGLVCTQRRKQLGRGLEHKCNEDELGVSNLEKRRLRGDLLTLQNSLEGECSMVGFGSAPRKPGTGQEETATSYAQEGSG
ncbi:hypothetical protein HGM15179_013422 [Zosterops borbonicus]|uniref:Uncharacterized protein n=1 Tax=Zosterops borbonicus TaxID=364589 RepID=A0A8K1G8E8_9PASS|nr:hypothetical protein HGM15179_013422 [Zosterops borbonicus]